MTTWSERQAFSCRRGVTLTWVGEVARRASRWTDHQGVWRGAAWGIAATALIDGLSFSIFGNTIAQGPSFYLLTHGPGMRLPGVVLAILGVTIFATAHRRNHVAQAALYLTFVVGVTLMVFTVGGWLAARQVAVSAFSKWFLLNWVSLWLALTTFYRGGQGSPRGR